MELVVIEDIEQLIVNGQQKIAAQKKQMDGEEQEKNVLAMQSAVEMSIRIKEKLPGALAQYVVPSNGKSSLIRIPEAAEIRVEMDHGEVVFKILEFQPGYDDWGHYAPRLIDSWERDLEIALAKAREVGEGSYEKAEAEVEQRNLREEELNARQNEWNKFCSGLPVIARANLDDGCDINVSIAASLLSIANTLTAIQSEMGNRP